MVRAFGLCVCVLLVTAACRKDESLKFELMRSYNNFIHSVDELHEEGLEISVYFPGVTNYKEHVKEVLLKYIRQTSDPDQLIEFDEQGVVLCRFLGLAHHRYQVLSYELDASGNEAKMRVSINFNYDKNIAFSKFEDGTRVLIPGEPWGTVYEVTIGGTGNPVPRNQLKNVEVDVVFKKTNIEGYWQVRKSGIDPATLEFETSYQDF
ncbi:hypothetical protein [Acanthopleuribacter pedis]|uniref:Lipoprotein n=1 Tax=Acanthopleuribacter pedis TaxID=442870 RepID=A0A8J7U233_9BACT|nr:hypothetical protein [Acanthopleuribacter pedis]MBO1318843.1 hypothetical protein [Acanthopleuribacter pedis]